MDGIAIGAIGSHDVPLLVAVLAFMLASSVLGSIQPNFGWRRKAESEARLVKDLQDISQDGDMDEEVRLLKSSISKRVRHAYDGGFRASLKRIAAFRLFHFIAVMLLMLLVGVTSNVLNGQYYISAENWRTLGVMTLFTLGFELIMGVVYLILERRYADSE